MIKTDVRLEHEGYIAEFRSGLGGTCYRLYNVALDTEILRSPESEEELFANISLFGNPILFPPNRIRGGKFNFNGREYSFPVNEPKTGSHLHGTLREMPFRIAALDEKSVSFVYEAGEGEYLGFPHAFRVYRNYSLGADGLTEKTVFENLSDTMMPFMLAFHTTFALSGKENARLSVPVVREQMRDENYLPTLLWQSGRVRDEQIRSGEYEIFSSPLSALYQTDGKITEITDPVSNISIISECSEQYGYRMLWRGADSDFLCIEPQTVAIDCFHLDTPPEENGLIKIAAHGSITLSVRYAAQINSKGTV